MSARVEADDWVYEMFPKDTPPDACGSFASFKRLWDSKRKGEALPAWKDYQLEDFADWYGWINVEDIMPGEPFDTVQRVWGTNLTTAFGKDQTGVRMREMKGSVYSDTDFDMRTKMVETHDFRICYGPANWSAQESWKKTQKQSYIELPLADDGHTVDKFIALTLLTYPDE